MAKVLERLEAFGRVYQPGDDLADELVDVAWVRLGVVTAPDATPPVEEATAAPGERRTTTRKAPAKKKAAKKTTAKKAR